MSVRDASDKLSLDEQTRAEAFVTVAPEFNPTYADKNIIIAPGGDDTPTTFKDHLAGFALIAGVLFIGAIAGYFSRSFIFADPPRSTSVSVLNASIGDFDSSPATVKDGNLFALGSDASEQLLAIDDASGNKSLAMVNTHLGGHSAPIQTRLVSITPSKDDKAKLNVANSRLLGGKGLEMRTLADGTVVTATITGNELTLAKRDLTGRPAWSQAFPSVATSSEHVSMLATREGVVVTAPLNSFAQTQVISLSASGEILWNKVLDRPRSVTKTMIAVDRYDNIFAVFDTLTDTAQNEDRKLVLIAPDGNMIWQLLLNLAPDEDVIGITAAHEGGANVLISGARPRLESYDPDGKRLWRTDMPHLQFFNELHLLSAANGDTIVATTYSLIGKRVDVSLERRDDLGLVSDQRSITLPDAATMDVIHETAPGRFLIGGSIRRGRYLPTDLFLKEVAFAPLEWPIQDIYRSTTNVELISESDAPTLISSTQKAPTAKVQLAVERTAPVSTRATTRRNIDPAPTPQPVIEDTPSQPATPPPGDADDESTVADESPVEPELAFVRDVAEEEEIDLDAAAVSRFITDAEEEEPAEPEIASAQCRFVCQDGESGSQFPMSGDVLQSVLLKPADLAATHGFVCEAANLEPALDVKPNCRFD